MNFRIAFGSASCKDPKFRAKKHVAPMCNGIESRLELLKKLSVEQLDTIKDGEYEVENQQGVKVHYTVYKQTLEDGILFVVQGFVYTFTWPTYISLNAVGHIAAEGIVMVNGEIREAEDDYLWGYR